MTEKKLAKICIIKDKDIIGLDDMLFGDKSIFTIEVISQKAEVFELKNKVKKKKYFYFSFLK